MDEGRPDARKPSHDNTSNIQNRRKRLTFYMQMNNGSWMKIVNMDYRRKK